jgi:hypothetical protein
VVTTGASSGIGTRPRSSLGGKAPRSPLAARNKTAREVERLGGEAHVVVTDVANWEQVNRWLGGTWLTMSTLESLTRDLHPGTDLAILLGDQ